MTNPNEELKTCRHKDFWIMAGGVYCWCPDCGSIRRLHEDKWAWKRWLKPQGQDKTITTWKKMISFEGKI